VHGTCEPARHELWAGYSGVRDRRSHGVGGFGDGRGILLPLKARWLPPWKKETQATKTHNAYEITDTFGG
jgi:hypothetical protein